MIFATNENYLTHGLCSELGISVPDRLRALDSQEDPNRQALDSIEIAKKTLESFVKSVRTYYINKYPLSSMQPSQLEGLKELSFVYQDFVTICDLYQNQILTKQTAGQDEKNNLKKNINFLYYGDENLSPALKRHSHIGIRLNSAIEFLKREFYQDGAVEAYRIHTKD
ncbi:MAG: hypothetical protein C0432_04025, partial [Candidatus Puniceispirillum sp.]|nr:hypothetical protein [Candidatus Pelagibacter sp.]MBA4283443.1 hypothetical protein [Candidatus Puniceispirillum sp.]